MNIAAKLTYLDISWLAIAVNVEYRSYYRIILELNDRADES